jgi:anti-anti-sigma factor
MTLTRPGVNEVWVIALEGEVDPGKVIALQRKINRALDSGRGRVIIDLGAVRSVGAQTLSLFCGALRRLNRGAALAIVGADPRVRRVLEGCAIDGLALYPTINAALAAGDDRAIPAPSPTHASAEAGEPGQAQVGEPAGGLARPRAAVAARTNRRRANTSVPASGRPESSAKVPPPTVLAAMLQSLPLRALIQEAPTPPPEPTGEMGR